MTRTRWLSLHLAIWTSSVVLSAYPSANAQNILWTRQFGTDGFDIGSSIAVDEQDYVYVAGATPKALEGSPPLGGVSAYLRKYNTAGDIIWAKQFGREYSAQAGMVTSDQLGNLYLSGSGKFGSPLSIDATITKFDTSGNQVWLRHFGSSQSDRLLGISADGLGNVFASGHTEGSLAAPYAGNTDGFVTKYDAFGNQQWTRQFGTNKFDTTSGCAADGFGNVYVSGSVQANLFGPLNGSGDAFLAKYDAAGTLLWGRQFGSAAMDWAVSVATDAQGNAYVSGGTFGDMDGPVSGQNDAFVRKYDPNGNVVWTRQYGGMGSQDSSGIAVDSQGGIYLSGGTTNAISSPPLWDIFVTKYDASGNNLWTSQVGSPADDYFHGGSQIDVDSHGNAYAIANTEGNVGGENAGSFDPFFFKVGPMPGDFDLDNDVDGADFIAWQTNFPRASGATLAQGDADHDGDVDGADFVVWQTNFPYTAGTAIAPVPEPATFLLFAMGSFVALWRRTWANSPTPSTPSAD